MIRAMGLPDPTNRAIVHKFSEEEDGHSLWGLTSAVTGYAREVENQETRHELERGATELMLQGLAA